jgi:hypothetical protein
VLARRATVPGRGAFGPFARGGRCQVLLAAGAWWDLARRPADRVRGPKWLWAPVIAVNFAGPVLYFSCGRIPPRATSTGQSA